MKRISPLWIFFVLSLLFLGGLVAAYTLRLSMAWQGFFLAGLILTVILGKLRMGLRAISEKDRDKKRERWDDHEDPRSLSIGNLRRHTDETFDEPSGPDHR